MFFQQSWERTTLLELRKEYRNICLERKLTLKPVGISLFDSKTLWGQFDGSTRTIYISRKLIDTQPWHHVLGVLKHEMAHQVVYESSPEIYQLHPHGEEFQNACKKIGVPAPFTRSQIGLQNLPLDWKADTEKQPEIRILEKVKKLLSLAASKNEHEAGSAMQKVQQIFAQYNLEQIQTWDRSHFVHLIVNNGKKRQNAWEQRIVSLLIEFYFVEIIMIRQFDPKSNEYHQAFEMIGTKENVLMAEYVYHFLLTQLDYLLALQKNLNRSQKASYRLGVLEGFAEKLKSSLRSDSQRASASDSQVDFSILQKALIKFEKSPQLKSYLKEIYPRLQVRRSHGRLIDTTAFNAGHTQGRLMTLHKPIEKQNSGIAFLGSKRK